MLLLINNREVRDSESRVMKATVANRSQFLEGWIEGQCW